MQQSIYIPPKPSTFFHLNMLFNNILFLILYYYFSFVCCVCVVSIDGILSIIDELKNKITGCCDVVLNREEFFNVTSTKTKKPATEDPVVFGPQLYRKSLNIYTGEISMSANRD